MRKLGRLALSGAKRRRTDPDAGAAPALDAETALDLETAPDAETAPDHEAAPDVEAALAGPPCDAPLAGPPWPFVGDKVVVGVEELGHQLRMGDKGVCEGPAPADQNEVLVRFHGAREARTMRIPRALPVPQGKAMSSMRYWDKCSEQLKQGLLMSVGMRDPRHEALAATSTVSLTMWGEFLRHGLNI